MTVLVRGVSYNKTRDASVKNYIDFEVRRFLVMMSEEGSSVKELRAVVLVSLCYKQVFILTERK